MPSEQINVNDVEDANRRRRLPGSREAPRRRRRSAPVARGVPDRGPLGMGDSERRVLMSGREVTAAAENGQLNSRLSTLALGRFPRLLHTGPWDLEVLRIGSSF